MQRKGTGDITCEICGRTLDESNYYRVNGSKMLLCKICAARGNYEKVKARARGGSTGRSRQKTNKSTTKARKKKQKTSSGGKQRSYAKQRLVQNYGEKIRTARLRSNLTKKELARNLKEKASYISKIEKEKMRPPKDLISKLEGLLEINLTEKSKSGTATSMGEEEGEVTVGDVVRIKGKKEEDKG